MDKENKMNKYAKVFDISGGISVSPNNYTYLDNSVNSVYVGYNHSIDDCYLQLSIDQVKELIYAFVDIVDMVENKPSIGSNVEINRGAFAGVKGTIFDIDDVATERELIVKVPKSPNNDELFLYINLEDIVHIC